MYLATYLTLFLRPALLAVILTMFASGLLFSTVRAAPPLQTPNCQTAPAAPDPSGSVCISRVVIPFNGVSPDNQFYVSWRSVNAEKGQVKLDSGETSDDVRGAAYQGVTHYVAVSNLDAKKTYTFDIVSGGQTFTNNGAHWDVRTGAALQATNPYTIFGRVKNPDGSDADGAIVYAQVRDGDDVGSQGRSGFISGVIVLADGGNFFTIDLDLARTQNFNQKFVFDPEMDRVQIIVVGKQGTASKTFVIQDLHPPAPPPSLILSGSGAGTAATATPSLVPPTATPTLTPTLTPTVTLTPTATPTFFVPTETPVLPTETLVIPTIQNPIPTLAPAEATRVAVEPTRVAIPAGQEIEPTRIFGGVPTVQPPPPAANNNLLVIFIAVFLFVGAVLLGAAAFFVSRR